MKAASFVLAIRSAAHLVVERSVLLSNIRFRWHERQRSRHEREWGCADIVTRVDDLFGSPRKKKQQAEQAQS